MLLEEEVKSFGLFVGRYRVSLCGGQRIRSCESEMKETRDRAFEK